MSGNKLDVSKVPKDASSVPEDQVRQLADHSSQMGGMAGMSGMNHHNMHLVETSVVDPASSAEDVSSSEENGQGGSDEYEAILDELEKASKIQALLNKYQRKNKLHRL